MIGSLLPVWKTRISTSLYILPTESIWDSLSRGFVMITRAPFRSVFEPEGVCGVHGSNNSPAEMAGHLRGHISERLAAAGTVGAGGQGAHGYSNMTPIRSRFRDRCGKEHAVSSTGHNLSGIITGLSDFHSTPLGGTSESFKGMPRTLSSRQICSIQSVSSITRADGTWGNSILGWPHAGWIPCVMAHGECWSHRDAPGSCATGESHHFWHTGCPLALSCEGRWSLRTPA